MSREESAVGTVRNASLMLRLGILAALALVVDFVYLATVDVETVGDVAGIHTVAGIAVPVPYTPGALVFSVIIAGTVFWMTFRSVRGHAIE